MILQVTQVYSYKNINYTIYIYTFSAENLIVYYVAPKFNLDPSLLTVHIMLLTSLSTLL